MRENKFRGKRLDNGKWAYGNLIEWKCWVDNKWISHKAILNGIVCNREPLKIDFVEVIPESIGQFSDVEDKNGTEICEGDIYHQGDKNIKYVVVWNDTGLIGKQMGSSSYAGLQYFKNDIEVIGNIYETEV